MKHSRRLKKKAALCLGMLLTVNTCVISSIIVSGTATAESSDIISKAAAYLETKAAADGSFGDSSIINDTSYALSALRTAGTDSHDASVKWLADNADNSNTDIIARIAASTGDGSYLGKLETQQNKDGGFGLYPDYASDVIDSVLVLEAVNETGYSGENITGENLLTYFLGAVNEDGGYAWADYNKSEPMLTAMAVYDICTFLNAHHYSAAQFASSVSYVEKITDSYEDSDIQTTICKYLALDAAGANPDLSSVIDELGKAQKEDGSFAESIPATYFAIKLANAANGGETKPITPTTTTTVTTTAVTTTPETTTTTSTTTSTETTTTTVTTTTSTSTTATPTTTTTTVTTPETTASTTTTVTATETDAEVTTIVTTETATVKFLLGDVNRDNIVDGRDATETLVHYSKISAEKESALEPDQLKAADVNADKVVDGRDASAILTYYAYVSTGHEISVEDFISNQNHE